MQFSILTLFPEAIEPYFKASLLGRAHEQGLMDTQLISIRDFATDKHKSVDDTPYGGGAGMVLMIEPIHRALESLGNMRNSKTIVLSARGQQFTQTKAQEYAQLDRLTLICGRYEGIDQRVADHLADEELSIGNFVLAGGEVAAMAIVEATARLIPGVLGNEESLVEESFSQNLESMIQNQDIWREYPHYTKPTDYNGWKVPGVLLSGNHKEIKKWREEQQMKES